MLKNHPTVCRQDTRGYVWFVLRGTDGTWLVGVRFMYSNVLSSISQARQPKITRRGWHLGPGRWRVYKRVQARGPTDESGCCWGLQTPA